MMAKQTVLLQGATGETGRDILGGLLEDGNFEITCLVRPESANKPAVQDLKSRGVQILVLDVSGDLDEIVKQIKPFNTIISAIGPGGQLNDLKLVEAAAKAGTKRFVPCGWTTICPPGGIMRIRDEKEKVHASIWRHHLPYTIIDVGFWYQISFPRLPSGKVDYAMGFKESTIYDDGSAPNVITDKRDIGRFVARIIKDERTLNKRVFTASEVLTQNEIWKIMEEKSGEKVETVKLSTKECLEKLEEAKHNLSVKEKDRMAAIQLYIWQYVYSKYVRKDNTPEIAKYLGYIDARELYPDFKPISFSEFVDELLAGKGKRPYADGY